MNATKEPPMLDGTMRKLINPPLDSAGRTLAGMGISANGVTLFGLVIGLSAAVLIAAGLFWWGLLLIILSRIADGLDGAVARATRKTDFGGYLDIVADFLFYGAIPVGFAIADPGANAVPASFLLLAFYFNGATFLGYAILAERHKLETKRSGEKTLFYADGLMEGTETIAFFVAFCVWPAQFVWLAVLFAVATLYTATARLIRASREFRHP